MKAVERFDPDRETRFSTYATWWITESIMRGRRDNKLGFSVPVHLDEAISKFKKVVYELEQEKGFNVSPKDVAKKMGVSEEKVFNYYLCAYDTFASLDQPVGAQDETPSETLGDFVPDQGQNVEDIVMKNMLKSDIEVILEKLKPIEREVLEYRYGLKTGDTMTLNEVGKIYGVTRERVRQIEANALRKARNRSYKNKKAKGLIEYNK